MLLTVSLSCRSVPNLSFLVIGLALLMLAGHGQSGIQASGSWTSLDMREVATFTELKIWLLRVEWLS